MHKRETSHAIKICDMIWPSSSCAHDLQRHRRDTLISIVASLSSHQLLLLRLSLPLSDKVKQLHGDCIAYNKATTIWLLPVADNSVTKHDHLIQKIISHHVLTISHHIIVGECSNFKKKIPTDMQDLSAPPS